VVFAGPYEHHSNELPWRETIADVVVIGADADGHIDLADLAAQLGRYASRPPSARRSCPHHLDTYLLPRIATIPLAMLTAADLEVMFTTIGRQRPAIGAPLPVATLARIRTTLRAALNAVIRDGLIPPIRPGWLSCRHLRGRPGDLDPPSRGRLARARCPACGRDVDR
jgi:hypothetical protein